MSFCKGTCLILTQQLLNEQIGQVSAWPQCLMWTGLIMFNRSQHDADMKPFTPECKQRQSHSCVSGWLEFALMAASDTEELMSRDHEGMKHTVKHSGGRCSFTWLLSSGTRASILPHGFPLIFIFASVNLLCVRARSETTLSQLVRIRLKCFETVAYSNNEPPQSQHCQ